jgi:hypothetical protein
MLEFRVNDVSLWLSEAPETALNTHYTAGAEYIRILNGQGFYILPEMEKRNDANRPGNGHEFATYTCNHYWTHPAVTLEDEVNVNGAGRLLLRSASGAVATQLLETGVTKHSAAMLPVANGRQNKASDFIALLGGSSFLLAGGVVERYRLFQNRADPPRYQADLVFTGKHIRPHGVTSLPASADIIQCLDGNQSVIQWTDDGGLRDFAALGRVLSWFCEVNNATKLNDRRPGDPSTSNGTDGKAAYVRRMLHGNRVVTAQIVITSDNDVYEWLRMTTNQALTDVTFSARSTALIGATQRAALTMIVPNGRIVSVTPGEDDGDQTATINIVGYYDATSGGALETEVVNNIASSFD